MSITDQRWQVQLMNIPHGTRFHLMDLPIYPVFKDDPRKLVEFQREFEDWIKSTNEQFVSRGASDYLKV